MGGLELRGLGGVWWLLESSLLANCAGSCCIMAQITYQPRFSPVLTPSWIESTLRAKLTELSTFVDEGELRKNSWHRLASKKYFGLGEGTPQPKKSLDEGVGDARF